MRHPDHVYVADLRHPASGGSYAVQRMRRSVFDARVELVRRCVGAANREQIERVFHRAFVFMLPANATFSVARAATIQAARDLYGSGGAVERAVTEAWTAVGVN